MVEGLSAPRMPHDPVVAVIGDGDPRGPDAHRVLEWAEEVGTLLARGGATVVTGGLGGVMQAASKGALGAGGLTIGFLPGEDSTEANDDVPSCLWVAARVVAVGAGARRIEPKHAHAEIGRERLLDRRATGIGHGPANDLANVASARRAPADLDVVSRRVLGSRQVQRAIARNV